MEFLKLWFQQNVCDRCHDLLIMSINFSDIAILNIKGSENETINLLQSADLTKENETL